jgi:hypothetical protein
MRGTEGAKIENNLFERLDGLGVLLKGYHRNASLSNNDFAWLGATAMAGWGETSYNLNANGTKRSCRGRWAPTEGTGTNLSGRR